jgi:hypothetical protein
MATINIPDNPTKKQLSEAISQRFYAETSAITQAQWNPGSGDDGTVLSLDVAQERVKDAYTSANAFLEAIEKMVASVPDAEQKLVAPFQQAWWNFVGTVLRNDSPDTRKALLDSSSPQLTTSWQNIDTQIQQAPDLSDAIKQAIQNLQTVADYMSDVRQVSIDLPLREHFRAVLNEFYPDDGPWSEFSQSAKDNVTALALERAGLKGASEAVEFFGYLSLAVSVGLAFWDAINNSNNYAPRLFNNLLQIGGGFAGGILTANAWAGSDASVVMGMVWGTGGDILAALIPTGVGLLVGLGVAALIGVLFTAIFGDGTDIPASLRVAITVPITTTI